MSAWFARYGKQTLVFGHRGAKAYAPQNTLPAFALALAQGAQGVELDVQLSRDGALVVFHDAEVDALTNGTGRVQELSLAELKALDAGVRFDPRFDGVTVPTLDEVFAEFGTRLLYNVEIKSLPDDGQDGIEQKVAETIARFGLEAQTIVSSFNPHALLRFRALMSQVAVGVLHEPAYFDPFPALGDMPYEAYHPHHDIVDEAMIARETAAGRVVNVWTLNDADRARQLKAWGVHAMITDVPDVILQALA